MAAAHQKPPLVVTSAAITQTAIQASQRHGQRGLVADAVLDVAEAEGTERRRDVEHEDQHHGLARDEADHLLRIDRRQRGSPPPRRLVADGAGQQPHEVAVGARLAEGGAQLLPGTRRLERRRGGLRVGLCALGQQREEWRRPPCRRSRR